MERLNSKWTHEMRMISKYLKIIFNGAMEYSYFEKNIFSQKEIYKIFKKRIEKINKTKFKSKFDKHNNFMIMIKPLLYKYRDSLYTISKDFPFIKPSYYYSIKTNSNKKHHEKDLYRKNKFLNYYESNTYKKSLLLSKIGFFTMKKYLETDAVFNKKYRDTKKNKGFFYNIENKKKFLLDYKKNPLEMLIKKYKTSGYAFYDFLNQDDNFKNEFEKIKQSKRVKKNDFK